MRSSRSVIYRIAGEKDCTCIYTYTSQEVSLLKVLEHYKGGQCRYGIGNERREWDEARTKKNNLPLAVNLTFF